MNQNNFNSNSSQAGRINSALNQTHQILENQNIRNLIQTLVKCNILFQRDHQQISNVQIYKRQSEIDFFSEDIQKLKYKNLLLIRDILKVKNIIARQINSTRSINKTNQQPVMLEQSQKIQFLGSTMVQKLRNFKQALNQKRRIFQQLRQPISHSLYIQPEISPSIKQLQQSVCALREDFNESKISAEQWMKHWQKHRR